MAQILVRGIDEDVKRRLQGRAARHHQSVEAEVRDILSDAVKGDHPAGGLGSELAALFRGVGLKDQEAIEEMHGFTIQSPFPK